MRPREEEREQSGTAMERLDFVVGSEMRLEDILRQTDISPLLVACGRAGASGVAICDGQGALLKGQGDISGIGSGSSADEDLYCKKLYYEGEPVGSLCALFAESADKAMLSAVMEVAHSCISLIVSNTAKRMLTTELHTTVVHQSYEELLETNRKLQASQKKYRELAESLEQKVSERTGELKRAYAHMLQQEKMASIGQLAAGMAHEINNPIGFVASNLSTFEGYLKRISEMIKVYRDSVRDGGSAGQKTEDLFRKLKIGFILEDSLALISQSRDGAERVRKIVANLKGFSHIDDARDDYVDINAEIDRTIGVLENESRDRAVFIRHYGTLPKYLCNPGLICQVFLHIIQNAVQASEVPVQIRVATAAEDDHITITIEDDGPGIPEGIIGRIFEPFFTTRDVGKGMGLGLSIAYDVVANHGGRITASSVAGEGAAFTISLPLKGHLHV